VTQFSLVVGLGNPGPRYKDNRHNIGFQVIDALEFTRTEHFAQTAHGSFMEQRIILAKPQTWMNDSGKAVAPLVHYYKIAPEHMLVVYDDLDIPLGTIRFRASGTSGGHRGVQSIIQHLGLMSFHRLRLGIGRPPGQMDPAAYVLQNYGEEEQSNVVEVQKKALILIQGWLVGKRVFSKNGMTWRIQPSSEEK
jgi:PTH1 family peptidyl-tRNA hydrolase